MYGAKARTITNCLWCVLTILLLDWIYPKYRTLKCVHSVQCFLSRNCVSAMSHTVEIEELTTDSVPEAPRESVVNLGHDADLSQNDLKANTKFKNTKPTNTKPENAKSPNTKPSSTKKSPKKSPSPRPSVPHHSAATVTYNISNASNLHIGNIVTVHVGSQTTPTADSWKKEKPKEKSKKVRELLENCEIVTEEDIDTVADHIGQGWKDVGKRLEFSDGQLEQLYENSRTNQTDFKEVVYQMLLDWKRYKDNKATVGVLCESLWHAKQYDAVMYLAKQKSRK